VFDDKAVEQNVWTVSTNYMYNVHVKKTFLFNIL
jgi:hypothetical protein